MTKDNRYVNFNTHTYGRIEDSTNNLKMASDMTTTTKSIPIKYYLSDVDDICDAHCLITVNHPEMMEKSSNIRKWDLLETVLGLDWLSDFVSSEAEASTIAEKIEYTPGPRARDMDVKTPLIHLYTREYAFCFNEDLTTDEIQELTDRICSYMESIGLPNPVVTLIHPDMPPLRLAIVPEDSSFGL